MSGVPRVMIGDPLTWKLKLVETAASMDALPSKVLT